MKKIRILSTLGFAIIVISVSYFMQGCTNQEEVKNNEILVELESNKIIKENKELLSKIFSQDSVTKSLRSVSDQPFLLSDDQINDIIVKYSNTDNSSVTEIKKQIIKIVSSKETKKDKIKKIEKLILDSYRNGEITYEDLINLKLTLDGLEFIISESLPKFKIPRLRSTSESIYTEAQQACLDAYSQGMMELQNRFIGICLSCIMGGVAPPELFAIYAWVKAEEQKLYDERERCMANA